MRGKGANLGEMIRAGLLVPDEFVILTGAYREFVKANGLNSTIPALMWREREKSAGRSEDAGIY